MQKSNHRHPGLRAALVVLMGLLCSGLLRAQETGLEIRDASTQLTEGVWYLSARIDYRLNRDTLEALQNGIALTFELQVELTRQRNWLPDEDVAELRQDYELSWQPLSRGYLVRNKNSGAQRAHTTLFAALNDLGRISDLPLIDATLVKEGENYEVSLRALLDQQQLPGPLRMLAFWDDNYALESDWYRWDLRTGEKR
ncbi:MAG: DUF4390 domain-containing protein [Chromatiales bacterium]|nr:DUF4390 domain-containing protein [Chromatiales bacterium]